MQSDLPGKPLSYPSVMRPSTHPPIWWDVCVMISTIDMNIQLNFADLSTRLPLQGRSGDFLQGSFCDGFEPGTQRTQRRYTRDRRDKGDRGNTRDRGGLRNYTLIRRLLWHKQSTDMNVEMNSWIKEEYEHWIDEVKDNLQWRERAPLEEEERRRGEGVFEKDYPSEKGIYEKDYLEREKGIQKDYLREKGIQREIKWSKAHCLTTLNLAGFNFSQASENGYKTERTHKREKNGLPSMIPK